MPSIAFYADVEGAYDSPERVGRLSSVLSTVGGSGTLVVGGGDTIGPSLLSVVTEGRGALALYEAVGADVDVFGNHEFDYGLEAIRDVVRDSPQTWLGANVHEGDDHFAADAGAVPWTTVVVDGDHVGVFGVSHPETAAMAPNAAGLDFGDPVVAAVEATQRLEERGVDWVVGVSHAGDDGAIAREADVDVLLGGHNNDRRTESVAGTTVVHTAGEAREVVDVRLGDEGDVAVRRRPTADAPVDRAVVDRLETLRQEGSLDAPVGRCESPLPRTDPAGDGPVGNFVADALRSESGADAALVNSGAIREGPPLAGTVTVGDLLELVPFPQPVVVVEVTGEELRETVAEAAGKHADPDETRAWHAHVSGLSVGWNAADERIEWLAVDGSPVRPDATYRVATLLYVVVSDHLFRTVDERHRVESVGPHHEIIAAHARDRGFDGGSTGRVEIVEQ